MTVNQALSIARASDRGEAIPLDQLKAALRALAEYADRVKAMVRA